MDSVKKRAEGLLSQWARTEVLGDDRSPRVEVTARAAGDRWPAQAALASAYLATEASETDTFHGSRPLLDFSWLALKQGLKPINERRPGAIESAHFSIRPLFDAYELLRPHASMRDRDRLDGRFARFMEQFADALTPRFQAHGMNDMDLGTGLNHTVCWAALLCQGSRLFGEPKWTKLALAWARRVADSQHESGYVSEHVGPSVLYDCLTLEALGRIYCLTGDDTVGTCARKLARFLVLCVYPNMRTVATFDERGRGRPFLTAPTVGFQVIPEGRRLLERMVDRGWELAESGEPISQFIGPVAASLVFLRDGRSRRLPCERKSSLFQAGKQALIRRRAPWFYVLSAFGNPPPAHNVFFHERTSILSIYHDAVGRIVGGGNDRSPEYAAFCCRESDWIYYCIPRGGSARAGRNEDSLDLDYGAADLHIDVRTTGERDLLLRVHSDLRERRDECFLNLQLPLEGVEAVTLGSGRTVKLKADLKLRHHKAGRLLEAGSWRIEAPKDCVFIWPHHPYVPYPRRGVAQEAVGFLRVPLAPVRASAEVHISITPGAGR